MATRRPAHNTPIHMDFLYGSLLERQEIHVDRRDVGWSAGLHVDRPCGGQISPWPARKVTDSTDETETNLEIYPPLGRSVH